jgi:acetyl esterase/lipase
MRTGLIYSIILFFASLFLFIRFPGFVVGKLMREPGRSLLKRVFDFLLAAIFFCILPIKTMVSIFTSFFLLGIFVLLIFNMTNLDLLAIFLNLASGLILINYIFKVTRPTQGFPDAFGADWIDTLTPSQRSKLTAPPYRFPWAKNRNNASVFHKDGTITYHRGTETTLLCDIWEPAHHIDRSGLAIIHLHATAWQGMDKGQLIKPLFTRLNYQGHLVLDLAYSLTPEAKIEDMVFDLKATIAWLKQNAAKYKIDPDKIVLMGESGGGQLALLCAYTPNHPDFQPATLHADTSVCGVIAIHAPTDLSIAFEEYGEMEPAQPEYSHQIQAYMKPKKFNRTKVDKLVTKFGLLPEYRYSNMPGGILLMVDLMGGTLNEIPEKYAKFSPITHVNENSPPTLYLIGEHDWYYQRPYGDPLDKALKKARRTSITINFPMADHGFALFVPRVSPVAQNTYHTIEHFLAMLNIP